MQFNAEPSDAFNFGFRDNSMEEFPPADFQSNPSEFSAIKQIPQRKSLINFSALGNTSGNTGMLSGLTNQNNSVSNPRDNMRLIPSRFLSNAPQNDFQNNYDDQSSGRNQDPGPNPYKSSPQKNNFDLPPLSTLLGFSDQDSGQSSPQSPPSNQYQKPQNQPQFLNNQFFHDEFSDKTSVTISDSSSGKAIPQATMQSKKNVVKKSKKVQPKEENSYDEAPDVPNNNQVHQKPPPEIKMNIDTAFDSAISNFNHYFFNEFKSILKPCSLPISTPEIDNFTNSLSDEISKSIVVQSHPERNQALISRTNDTVDVLLKEETTQMKESMKQKSIRQQSEDDKYFQDLNKLFNEIKEMTTQYRDVTIRVLKSLNHERTEIARINNTDQMKQKTLLDSQRKLNLKRLELESIKNKQNNEVFLLQRSENNLYASREELREKLLNSYDSKFNKLRTKIISEIDSLSEYIEDPILETISSNAEEIKSILRIGIDQQEQKEQMMFDEMQNAFYQMHCNPAPKNENNADNKEFSNIKSAAMKKLEELKKKREKAFEGIYPKKARKK